MDINLDLFTMLLFSFLVFTEVRNYAERKRLTDQLMSRDFTDYVSNDVHRRKVSTKIEKRDETIPL